MPSSVQASTPKANAVTLKDDAFGTPTPPRTPSPSPAPIEQAARSPPKQLKHKFSLESISNTPAQMSFVESEMRRVAHRGGRYSLADEFASHTAAASAEPVNYDSVDTKAGIESAQEHVPKSAVFEAAVQPSCTSMLDHCSTQSFRNEVTTTVDSISGRDSDKVRDAPEYIYAPRPIFCMIPPLLIRQSVPVPVYIPCPLFISDLAAEIPDAFGEKPAVTQEVVERDISLNIVPVTPVSVTLMPEIYWPTPVFFPIPSKSVAKPQTVLVYLPYPVFVSTIFDHSNELETASLIEQSPLESSTPITKVALLPLQNPFDDEETTDEETADFQVADHVDEVDLASSSAAPSKEHISAFPVDADDNVVTSVLSGSLEGVDISVPPQGTTVVVDNKIACLDETKLDESKIQPLGSHTTEFDNDRMILISNAMDFADSLMQLVVRNEKARAECMKLEAQNEMLKEYITGLMQKGVGAAR
ncbi:hypothetical protein BC830DRAFT_1119011 [Chytriomyces sp. MP71]|nr:hypothetical protein BC830DRAFT_1119011 [Chytriomyces sp. MP71]